MRASNARHDTDLFGDDRTTSKVWHTTCLQKERIVLSQTTSDMSVIFQLTKEMQREMDNYCNVTRGNSVFC